MAWSQINIIYGVVVSFEELQTLFPDYDWSCLSDIDEDNRKYAIEEILEELITYVPRYIYNYQYSRKNRWTGLFQPLGSKPNQWIHRYHCCSKLSDTHLILGQIVGDVEPEQFLDLPSSEALPIWDQVLTLDQLKSMPAVKVKDSDCQITEEQKQVVKTWLKSINVKPEPQLIISADDCYSCT